MLAAEALAAANQKRVAKTYYQRMQLKVISTVDLSLLSMITEKQPI